MKVVFVRTPRYVWPFNSETSAFWQPLGFLSIAAQLQAARPDWSIRIIDCPASKMGWKTLLKMLGSNPPDIDKFRALSVSPYGKMFLVRAILKDDKQNKKSILIFWDGKEQKIVETDSWLIEALTGHNVVDAGQSAADSDI